MTSPLTIVERFCIKTDIRVATFRYINWEDEMSSSMHEAHLCGNQKV
jgi:hypothetical protein